jgi:hypothetical protein
MRDDPVMKEEASLSMKRAAPRYSSGVDRRFIMFSFSHSSFRCGSSSKFFFTIWVAESELVLLEAVAKTYWGHDVARTECVDSDALAAPFHCETATKLNNGRFRAVVYACAKTFVCDEGAH